MDPSGRTKPPGWGRPSFYKKRGYPRGSRLWQSNPVSALAARPRSAAIVHSYCTISRSIASSMSTKSGQQPDKSLSVVVRCACARCEKVVKFCGLSQPRDGLVLARSPPFSLAWTNPPLATRVPRVERYRMRGREEARRTPPSFPRSPKPACRTWHPPLQTREACRLVDFAGALSLGRVSSRSGISEAGPDHLATQQVGPP